MPWARIDDSFYDHPKLDRLGRHRMAAVGLHVLALSWCNRHLTDGLVPDARVVALGGSPTLAEALVKAGMWDRLDDRGAYLIHDFDHYNKSKRQVVTERAEWRDRQRVSRGVSRRDNGVTHDESHAESHGPVTKSRSRSRSRSRVSKETGTGEGSVRGGPEHIGAILKSVPS